MTKGSELTGVKRKLFFWAVGLAEQYDNIKSGGPWYDFQLAVANKLVFPNGERHWAEIFPSSLPVEPLVRSNCCEFSMLPESLCSRVMAPPKTVR